MIAHWSRPLPLVRKSGVRLPNLRLFGNWITFAYRWKKTSWGNLHIHHNVPKGVQPNQSLLTLTSSVSWPWAMAKSFTLWEQQYNTKICWSVSDFFSCMNNVNHTYFGAWATTFYKSMAYLTILLQDIDDTFSTATDVLENLLPISTKLHHHPNPISTYAPGCESSGGKSSLLLSLLRWDSVILYYTAKF